MEIKYDKDTNVKYIHIKDGKIARTKKIEPWLLFDIDETDDVLGVEILEESEHPTSVTIIGGKLFCYGVVISSATDDKKNLVELNIKSEQTLKQDNLWLLPA